MTRETLPHHLKHVAIMLPEDLRDELVAAAARAGLPVSTFGRLMIAAQLRPVDRREAA